MSYISEMSVGSDVTLKVTKANNSMEFETTIIGIIDQEHKHYGKGIKCKLVYINDKVANFRNTQLVATIKDKESGRDFVFNITASILHIAQGYMCIYCLNDVKPKNYRNAYRVPCGYRTNMQIGTNRKAIDGHVHDISFSGISLVYEKDKVKSDIGQKVSAMIYEDNDSERGYRVLADIVRIEEEWAKDKTLIGAKFDNSFTVANKDISNIVVQCQRKELKLRKENENKQ